MKKNILTLILLSITFSFFATEQRPDKLQYKGNEYNLSAGWGHPTPLQTYYTQNDIKYPFEMISTANYRGHIAFWEIKNNKLFLKKIKVRDKFYTPKYYKVRSDIDNQLNNNEVYADWFSGVISINPLTKKGYTDSSKTVFFLIRKGEVIKHQLVTNTDIKKIQKMSQKDTNNVKLMEKYLMLVLNENYVSYYFRLNSQKDTISFKDKSGYLKGNKGLSPVLKYYSNDHTKWPYYWENLEKNGAPVCDWKIINNKLYLEKINLHSGTGFYEINKDTVQLSSLFYKKIENNKVFADWISGIYIIEKGKNVYDEFITSYSKFKVDTYTFLRIDKGEILETYSVDKDFDFNNIPKDTNQGLKKILHELNN